MSEYFGESWCAATESGRKIETPAGSPCAFCDEKFVEGDMGVAIPGQHQYFYHKNCFLRTVVGSFGHQTKQCSCFGGTLEDPPELSLRAAADLAFSEFEKGMRK